MGQVHVDCGWARSSMKLKNEYHWTSLDIAGKSRVLFILYTFFVYLQLLYCYTVINKNLLKRKLKTHFQKLVIKCPFLPCMFHSN